MLIQKLFETIESTRTASEARVCGVCGGRKFNAKWYRRACSNLFDLDPPATRTDSVVITALRMYSSSMRVASIWNQSLNGSNKSRITLDYLKLSILGSKGMEGFFNN